MSTEVYQTVNTNSYYAGNYRIDIHTVRTEEGEHYVYHFDAAIWRLGECVADKGEFSMKNDALKWAYAQVSVEA